MNEYSYLRHRCPQITSPLRGGQLVYIVQTAMENLSLTLTFVYNIYCTQTASSFVNLYVLSIEVLKWVRLKSDNFNCTLYLKVIFFFLPTLM